jgi:tRNA dimethylallyltransferase
LHKRIEDRFLAMLEQGFVAEVEHLMSRPDFDRDSPAMRAVGYRQAISYILGEVDYATFVQMGIAATRQLAKRQITWMRGMT